MGFVPEISTGSPFTFQNIPFGVISTGGEAGARCATAIGDYALDLKQFGAIGLFEEVSVANALAQPNLNAFAALSWSVRTAARRKIVEAVKGGLVEESSFVSLDDVTMHLPFQLGEYTDFFCSLEHCQNCASLTGGSVPENFLITPSAYNGRASSVRPSPHLVRRPKGVFWKPGTKEPTYGLSRAIDFELEMGFFVSKAIPYGEELDVDKARDHIFGFVLLNDWSSRDIQRFEMPPLGPFNSKSFGTTISPWVVTLDALDPFTCAPKHETQPFKHLRYGDFSKGTFDVKLAAHLVRNGQRHELCTSNLRYLYWTPYQQITQHASAMCGLRVGDLIGTGTISGEKRNELGCLFELTRNGSVPVSLEEGQKVEYLLDGDEIVLTGWCEDGKGDRVLGFGECRGQVLVNNAG